MNKEIESLITNLPAKSLGLDDVIGEFCQQFKEN